MKAAAWIEIIVGAIERAIKAARDEGHEPPGARELEQIAKVAAEVVSLSLQVSIVGLAELVQAAALKACAEIDGLPKDPMCPRCGKPLRQFIAVSPGVPNPPGAPRVLKCDECDWSLP